MVYLFRKLKVYLKGLKFTDDEEDISAGKTGGWKMKNYNFSTRNPQVFEKCWSMH